MSFEKAGAEYQLRVGAYPFHYFQFQHSSDLQQFSTIGMALGDPGPMFGFTPAPGTLRGFLRAVAVSGWSPGDADQDGIDDYWELNHGLAPLDAADALLPSLLHPGMTYLESYHFEQGLIPVTDYYSVETSVLNRSFAISAETSVFNFSNPPGASLEAISVEVSLFNTAPLLVRPEAVSAEVSVFNTALITSVPEAIAPEVSVFNAYTPPGTTLAVSPEVSVLKN